MKEIRKEGEKEEGKVEEKKKVKRREFKNWWNSAGKIKQEETCGL